MGNVESFHCGHHQAHGIDVQAACDHRCRFVHMVTGATGSTNDVNACQQSSFPAMAESLPRRWHVVGDRVCTPTEHMLTPFNAPNTGMSVSLGSIGGVIVGLIVGVSLGSIGGVIVGLISGAIVGSISGAIVGSIHGVTVGSIPGAIVGLIHGVIVGLIRGAIIGLIVGVCLGSIGGVIVGSIAGVIAGSSVGLWLRHPSGHGSAHPTN